MKKNQENFLSKKSTKITYFLNSRR